MSGYPVKKQQKNSFSDSFMQTIYSGEKYFSSRSSLQTEKLNFPSNAAHERQQQRKNPFAKTSKSRIIPFCRLHVFVHLAQIRNCDATMKKNNSKIILISTTLPFPYREVCTFVWEGEEVGAKKITLCARDKQNLKFPISNYIFKIRSILHFLSLAYLRI